MKRRSSLAIATLFAATLALGCSGSDKKTTTPTGGNGDTATPVGTDGTGDGTAAANGDTQPTGADPALIAKGASVWEEHCSVCHGDAGEGAGKSPKVKGDGALAAFADDTALFEYTKKEMPKDDPGGLSDDDYKAVVAWMRN